MIGKLKFDGQNSRGSGFFALFLDSFEFFLVSALEDDIESFLRKQNRRGSTDATWTTCDYRSLKNIFIKKI